MSKYKRTKKELGKTHTQSHNQEALLKYIPLFIAILILAAFYYSFFILPNQRLGAKAKQQFENENLSQALGDYQQCNENSTAPCKINNCTGLIICKKGKWGPCTLNVTCKPGSKAPCAKESCSVGYRVCNECGTGYGECAINVSQT